MKQKIEQLHEVVNSWNANSLEELEAIRIKYLSKKGEISELFNQFREVPNEQKREIGQLLNHLRDTAQNRLNELKAALEAQRQEADKLDLTRTAEPITLGTRHPLPRQKRNHRNILTHRFHRCRRSRNRRRLARIRVTQLPT